jgi:hypothetical protein
VEGNTAIAKWWEGAVQGLGIRSVALEATHEQPDAVAGKATVTTATGVVLGKYVVVAVEDEEGYLAIVFDIFNFDA